MPQTSLPDSPRGLGGWLASLVFFQLLSVLDEVIRFLVGALPGVYDLAPTLWRLLGYAPFPGFMALLASAIVAGAYLFSTSLLLKRSAHWPRSYVLCMWLEAALGVLDLALWPDTFRAPPDYDRVDIATGLAGLLISLLVVLIYLRRSKRVANTFVR
jgi:hypothetical protein